MTTEAATTPALSGSDSVRTSLSLEDAANIDFYDPDEDQGTVEDEQDQHSESETDEADDGQEADEFEASEDGDDVAEGEEQGEESSTPEPADDATVTIDGQKLTLAELKKGYHREADYTRQKQRVSQKEQQLEAMSARVTQSVDAIADFLIKQIPPAPNPQLAMTNPSQFVQQKALHEAATAQVEALLGQAGEVKAVSQALTVEQKQELIASENAKLVEAFPVTATDAGRQKFFETAASAAKELGYSEQEIAQAVDHRMFALAHYAAIGMRAEKAREKARDKVQNVPPVAAPKARQQGGNQMAARRNQEAKKRLARTGSIDDAMAIDFD